MKHLIKGYITSTQYGPKDKAEISFSRYKPSAQYSQHTVVVREHSFEIEVPDDFDPRPGMIASLEEQKQIVRAKFAAEVLAIDQRIQSLLAIENTVDAE